MLAAVHSSTATDPGKSTPAGQFNIHFLHRVISGRLVAVAVVRSPTRTNFERMAPQSRSARHDLKTIDYDEPTDLAAAHASTSSKS